METVFFPRSDYNVTICPHRYGKKITYTEQTDGIHNDIGNSYNIIMALAKARGIKLGAFALNSEVAAPSTIANALSDLQNGDVWLDTYSQVNGVPEDGSQQVTEVQWRDMYLNNLLPNFRRATGKKPVALSYSYGNTSFAQWVCDYYLAARGSGKGQSPWLWTDYGVGYGTPNTIPYRKDIYQERGSTSRWWDDIRSDLQSLISQGYSQTSNEFMAVVNTRLAQLSDDIDNTIVSGGWYNNFTHWYQMFQTPFNCPNVYEAYFNMLAQKNANGDICFAGYGEAVAYSVYRQMITKAVMYSPVQKESEQLVIQLETSNIFSVDTDLLQVPISIKFSTINTPLANQNIKSDCNLISLGSGEYIVEIPYGKFPKAVIEINQV